MTPESLTPKMKADELYLKFFVLNPYQLNLSIRTRIAKESAVHAVTEIEKYSEHWIDDGFWKDVKKEILKKQL